VVLGDRVHRTGEFNSVCTAKVAAVLLPLLSDACNKFLKFVTKMSFIELIHIM